MKRIAGFICLAVLAISCFEQEKSHLYDTSCDGEINQSGLAARLSFCNIANPSAAAINSCLNNTFAKVSSVSSSCKLDAASRAIDSGVKLLKYQSAKLLQEGPTTIKSEVAPADFKAFIDLTDLYFSHVKQFGAKEIHQKGVRAFQAVEDSIFQNIRILKSRQALMTEANFLDRMLPELLGLPSNAEATLQSARNVETVLPFTVPALSTMVDQLAFYTSIMGLYCDLGRCDGKWLRYQELVRLLTKLDQPESLDAAFHSRKTERPIDSVLTIFQGRGADLRTLVENVGSNPGMSKVRLTDFSVDRNYFSVAELTHLIRRLALFESQFNQTTQTVSKLQFGLDSDSRSAVEQRMEKIQADLKNTGNAFSAISLANFQNALNEIQTSGQNLNLKAIVESKQMQIARLIDQTLAAQAELDILETERHKYILNYNELAGTALGQDRSFFKFEGESINSIHPGLAPQDKTWPQTVNSPVSVMSALSSPVELKAGQIMAVEVTGQWSPVCALMKSPYGKSLGGVKPRIGPSGYQATVVDGKSRIEARSVSFSNKHQVANTQSVSQSLGAGYAMGIANMGLNYTGTDSSTNAKESGFTASATDLLTVADSASFAGGLRIEGTPFQQREYPAGALLVFRIPARDARTPEGEAIFDDTFNHVDQVMVVEPQTTLTATTDSRFYFIINDCNDSSTAGIGPESSHLTMKKSVYSFDSTKPLIKAALKAMDEAARKLEADGNAIIREGGAALVKLSRAVSLAKAGLNNTQIKDLPPEEQKLLLDYFQSYVDYVASKVQRKLEIRESGLQVSILNRELDGYERLLASGEQQARLRNLQTINIANNFHLSHVFSKARELIDFMRLQSLPLMRLYYPKNYRDLLANLRAEAIAGDAQDIPSILLALDHLADSISSGISKDLSTSLSTQRVTIALSFPRPGLDISTAGFPKDVPLASQDSSKAFWDMMFKPRNSNAFVRIEPAQLYEADGQNLFNRFNLSCNMSLPVVTNMGIFLYTSSGSISDADMSQVFDVGLQFGPDLLLPTRIGLQLTSLMDPEWGRNSVRARIVSQAGFNQIERTLAEDEKLGLVSGRGLSPFTQVSVTDGLSLMFDKGADKLDYPIDLDAITLAFQVDVDKSTPAEINRWISRCAAN